VLDCGGGSGSAAVPLAELGAEVTVVDISVDALATLRRRAAEAGVGEHVHAVQGDLESLDEVVSPASFDLVLLHGVLDVVDHRVVLAAAHDAVRPGGLVSVVIANPVAGVLSRLLGADVHGALDERRDSVRGKRLDLDRLLEQCAACGLTVEGIHGVGVFAEFTPGSVTDTSAGAAALAELEDLSSGVAPYRDIASRLHVFARRSTAV
jgi:SAM-dependent methyltransferase